MKEAEKMELLEIFVTDIFETARHAGMLSGYAAECHKRLIAAYEPYRKTATEVRDAIRDTISDLLYRATVYELLRGFICDTRDLLNAAFDAGRDSAKADMTDGAGAGMIEAIRGSAADVWLANYEEGQKELRGAVDVLHKAHRVLLEDSAGRVTKELHALWKAKEAICRLADMTGYMMDELRAAIRLLETMTEDQ